MGAPDACPICGHDPWPEVYGRAIPGPCECEKAELEIEEAAGLRKLRIEEVPLTSDGFEGWYSEWPEPAWLVVDCDLPEAPRRARELEAHGYFRWLPRPVRERLSRPLIEEPNRGFVFYRYEHPREVPDGTVWAIRSVIEEMEPSWVAAVAEARRYADDPRVVAAWCEIPLQAVMAAVGVLGRGR